MSTFGYIVLSSFLLALISLAGAIAILVSRKKFNQTIPYLVAFSAGALLGGAFFYLIPESIEALGNQNSTYLLIMGGLAFFYILEQFIHWHHCHRQTAEHAHPVSYLILIADGLHNFVDGLAVGASFIAGVPVGLATLIAVIAHEIPQELGDFGILIHSGWKAKKALLFNFISSLTFFLGALTTYFLAREMEVSFLIPVAAGGFIYIAATDLIPEVNKECLPKTRFLYFTAFIFGVGLLILTKTFLAE